MPHYYENQTTESPDVVFAQRLPPLVEQLVIAAEGETLDEKLIKQAEDLLALIIKPDHRAFRHQQHGQGQAVRTLRFVLTFRAVKLTEIDPGTQDLIKHLIPAGKIPKTATLLPILRRFRRTRRSSSSAAIAATERFRRQERPKRSPRPSPRNSVSKDLGSRPSRSIFSAGSRNASSLGAHLRRPYHQPAPPADIAAAIRRPVARALRRRRSQSKAG